MSERYGDLVDQPFSQYNEKPINNLDPKRQIEKDKTPRAEYPNENYSDNTGISKTSAIPNLTKSQKAKIPYIQSEEKSSMWFIHGLKIMYTMMSMMLNQCTCFFQAVEGHANLIW